MEGVGNNNKSLKQFVSTYISSLKEKNQIKEISINDISVNDISLNDIFMIISTYFKKDKNYLYINWENIILNGKIEFDLEELLNKYYIENVPLQYITGIQPFYNEEYIVNENVLIPRQDTEILVEKAIEYINKYNLESMLDLCSGSGCIGISISNNSNIKECMFADISKEALDVTNKNLIHNRVSKKVLVMQSDLFSNIKEKFDIIVSNPPYIKTGVIKFLDKKVQNEPILALDGGKDGLQVYIRILNTISFHLNDGGYFMFEIGYDQLKDIEELINDYDYYELVEKVKDYSGNNRVVICRFHQK